jgi:hypothetical protein
VSQAPTREELDRRIATTANLGDKTRGATSARDFARPTGGEQPRLRVVRNAFPLEALPPAAAEYAFRLSENGIPTEYVGPALLGCLAGAVGGRAKVEVNEGAWSERAALWIALVGESGTLKSPAVRAARAALDDLQRPRLEKWRQDLDVWKALPRGEQVRTPKPKLSRLVVGDATIEALARTLADNSGGLILISDELASLVRGLDQYKPKGGNDRPHLLSMWSGEPMIIDRVSGDGDPIYVPEPTLSVLGGIQPAMLKLLDGDDGLPGRWLYSNFPDNHDTDPEILSGLAKESSAWGGLVREIVTARHIQRTITLDGDGRERVTVIRKRMRTLWRGETGHVRYWAAKGGSHFLRLALVLSEARRPAGGNIDRSSLDAAEMLLDYFTAEVQTLPVKQHNLMTAPYQRGQDEAVDRLETYARQQSDHRVSRRDVQMRHIAHRTKEELTRLLERYEATHPGHVVTEWDRGERTWIYAQGFAPNPVIEDE